MSNLICKKDFNPCRTPGMCAPHGGCPGSDIDAWRKLLAENDRLFKLLERLIDQMLPVEELKDMPGYSRVLTAEVLLAERDQLKAENEALRKDAEKWKIVQRCMDLLQADERNASIWSACSLLLISTAHKLNSGVSTVLEEGVTIGEEEVGDWRVTVERVKEASHD